MAAAVAPVIKAAAPDIAASSRPPLLSGGMNAHGITEEQAAAVMRVPLETILQCVLVSSGTLWYSEVSNAQVNKSEKQKKLFNRIRKCRGNLK
jgi:hypothetical protein